MGLFDLCLYLSKVWTAADATAALPGFDWTDQLGPEDWNSVEKLSTLLDVC